MAVVECEKDIFPLLYFGPINYYHEIARAKQSLFVLNDRYAKQTYRSRCEIYGANGKLSLSIPVHRPFGNKTLMHEVILSDATPWRQIHWKSIKSAYGSAPFYEHYGPKVEELILNPTTNLSKYLQKIVIQTSSWLDIHVDTFDKIALPNFNQECLDKQALVQSLSKTETAQYWQVFSEKFGFLPNLSILDLLFNEGPQAQLIIHR